MISAIVVAAVAGLLVLVGVLGSRPGTPNTGIKRAYPLALPIAVASPAAAVQAGLTGWTALISFTTVLAALVLPAWLRRPDWPTLFRTSSAAAAVAWVAAIVVLVGFTLMFTRFASGSVTDVTRLNDVAVALVLVVAGIGVGVAGGKPVLQFRVAILVVSVVAVALLAIGMVVGTWDMLANPAVEVEPSGSTQYLVFPILVVVASAFHTGLRRTDTRERIRLTVNAGLVALTLGITLAGLLLVLGGALEVPSMPLNAILAFLPSAVGSVLAGLMAAVAVVVIGACTREALLLMAQLCSGVWDEEGRAEQPRCDRVLPVVVVVGGVAFWLLVVWSPAPVAVITTSAIAAVVGISGVEICRRRQEAPAPARALEDQPSQL